MELKIYQQLEEIFTDHWWFQGRLKILEMIFGKFLKYPSEILDVGCGTGSYFSILEKFGNVSGVESSQLAIDNLLKRGVKNKIFKAELPFMQLGKKFDYITALEIIEHIEDDKKTLCNIAEHLHDNGVLIGTVPAYRWLWSKHDDLAHHKHRYTKTDLLDKLRDAGFHVEKISYYNSFLFPIAAVVRLLKKTLLKNAVLVSDFSITAGPLDFLFEKIFASERYWLTYLNFPFGLSLIFVARKTNK